MRHLLITLESRLVLFYLNTWLIVLSEMNRRENLDILSTISDAPCIFFLNWSWLAICRQIEK